MQLTTKKGICEIRACDMLYLHYVDEVVWQPKEAESQDDCQDELLTPNATTEPGLSNPPQDEDVADYYDGIWN